jgi:hypothetical protein
MCRGIDLQCIWEKWMTKRCKKRQSRKEAAAPLRPQRKFKKVMRPLGLFSAKALSK